MARLHGTKTVKGFRYTAGWLLLPGAAQRGNVGIARVKDGLSNTSSSRRRD